MANEIEFVEAMKVLSLREGDVLIVKTGQRLSPTHNERLIAVIRDQLPEDMKGKVKVFVLEEGMDIGVLRAEAECSLL